MSAPKRSNQQSDEQARCEKAGGAGVRDDLSQTEETR